MIRDMMGYHGHEGYVRTYEGSFQIIQRFDTLESGGTLRHRLLGFAWIYQTFCCD